MVSFAAFWGMVFVFAASSFVCMLLGLTVVSYAILGVFACLYAAFMLHDVYETRKLLREDYW